jgi:CDP-paratose 2-epimerase
LTELTAWCDRRFGPNPPVPDGSERPYDVPWLILDSAQAKQCFDWQPTIAIESILEEIAAHVEANPNWLEQCGA